MLWVSLPASLLDCKRKLFSHSLQISISEVKFNNPASVTLPFPDLSLFSQSLCSAEWKEEACPHAVGLTMEELGHSFSFFKCLLFF